jgi:MFS superfamily sulfate permease-like transporter
MMAIVSGAVCILAGVARLGFVTELLSKPIRYGYMSGIALAVLVSQTPKQLGVKVEKAGPLRDIWSIAVEIAGGRMNWTEFALGAATLAVIFSIKTFKGPPGILLAVAGATGIVQVFNLETRAYVSVLAPLPLGLPAFSIPWVGVPDLTTVALGGLAAALVSFADTSVLSRSYAARLRQPVDPNQEMIGLGAANLGAGFFQGFPISSSSS